MCQLLTYALGLMKLTVVALNKEISWVCKGIAFKLFSGIAREHMGK